MDIAQASILHYYNRRHPFIRPKELATKARKIFRKLKIRFLPVVEEQRLLGVVTRERVLLISSTRSNARVSDIMIEPKVTLTPQTIVLEALKTMLSVDEWYAPVIDENGNYLGVFGLEDIITVLVENSHPSLNVEVSKYMTKDVVYVNSKDHITRLWNKMVRYRYVGFPVVNDEGKLVGVVTQYDLIKHGFTRIDFESETGPRKGPKIEEIMSTPPITIKSSATMLEAAETLISYGIGRIIVVDDKGNMCGIIDREDIIRAYLKYIGMGE